MVSTTVAGSIPTMTNSIDDGPTGTDCSLAADSRPTLLVLEGPTAVGKTEFSLRLAEHFHTSILSADSRQLYADIPIGTATPTAEQLARVKHHFVGTLALTDSYSAARYEQEALSLLTQLFALHKVVVLTGGSMMYIDAVCTGLDDIPTVDDTTRKHFQHRFEAEGLESLCDELSRVDPDYYAIVDRQNPRRVIHALEICRVSGRSYTSFRLRRPQPRPFRVIKVGLTRERQQLYERINLRVDQMMADGLLDEARRVYPLRGLNALNTVGYKELFQYLDGSIDLPTAVSLIKQNTRHYAKRQLTWLKRDPDIHWFHPDQETEILAFIAAQCV